MYANPGLLENTMYGPFIILLPFRQSAVQVEAARVFEQPLRQRQRLLLLTCFQTQPLVVFALSRCPCHTGLLCASLEGCQLPSHLVSLRQKHCLVESPSPVLHQCLPGELRQRRYFQQKQATDENWHSRVRQNVDVSAVPRLSICKFEFGAEQAYLDTANTIC